MKTNPIIYQINVRVWFAELQNKLGIKSLSDIPADIWTDFKEQGIDIIWLMGIWKTVPTAVKKYCFEPALIEEYKKALPEWNDEDVIGSPYSINSYTLNPNLGVKKDLIELKSRLNRIGLKLILDFIPNHFHAESSLIKSNPDIFLPGSEELLKKNDQTYFRSDLDNDIYCHGRDPYFPAWQDTIQINFFSQKAREYLINQLLDLTKFCDGVRCDMAMLALNNVFSNTWNSELESRNFTKPDNEFWEDAISKVRKHSSEFLFIGEVYWGHEWTLQQLGFDFTYDKNLYDKLVNGSANEIKEHLKADKSFQQKSLRFIENHDEKRASAVFGFQKSTAAAQIIGTIPGAKLFLHGQFDGKITKLPVQLGRYPEEPKRTEYNAFYKKLLNIISKDKFANSEWDLMGNFQSWEGDETYKNILCWSWHNDNDEWLVTINYSDSICSCRIFPEGNTDKEYIQLDDEINNKHYRRNYSDLQRIGLYIELQPYSSHIFKVS
jgi:glycosidase